MAERLTTNQEVPGSTPGWIVSFCPLPPFLLNESSDDIGKWSNIWAQTSISSSVPSHLLGVFRTNVKDKRADVDVSVAGSGVPQGLPRRDPFIELGEETIPISYHIDQV